MKKTLIAFAIGSILLASCGTGKKLKAANTLNEQLTSQVDGLNTKVAEVEKVNTNLSRKISSTEKKQKTPQSQGSYRQADR